MVSLGGEETLCFLFLSKKPLDTNPILNSGTTEQEERAPRQQKKSFFFIFLPCGTQNVPFSHHPGGDKHNDSQYVHKYSWGLLNPSPSVCHLITHKKCLLTNVLLCYEQLIDVTVPVRAQHAQKHPPALRHRHN